MIYIYRQHAIKRMFERGLTEADIEAVLANGKVIKDYPEDKPYPSCLWLGYSHERPVHIVYADNGDQRIIITVYEPDPTQWSDDFTMRITRCTASFVNTVKPAPEPPA